MTCIGSSVCDKLFIVAAATPAAKCWRAGHGGHDSLHSIDRLDSVYRVYTRETRLEMTEVTEWQLEIKNSCNQ